MRLNSTGVSSLRAGITMTKLVLCWWFVCRSWRWLTLGKVAVVVDHAFFREAYVRLTEEECFQYQHQRSTTYILRTFKPVITIRNR
jgi:hypothetical protein